MRLARSDVNDVKANEIAKDLRSGRPVSIPSGTVANFLASVLEIASSSGAVVLREEEMLTPSQTARVLGVSRPTVYAYLERGLLEDRRVGVDHRIPIESVEEFIQTRNEAEDEALRLRTEETDSPRVVAALSRVRERRSRR